MTFGDNYPNWNSTRIKAILDFYGQKFFYLKKILELGAGHGDIGGFFSRLGSEVTAVDARQEHLKLINKKYPNIKIVKSDLDSQWIFTGKPYDIILDLGLLCHLSNTEEHIKNICLYTNHLVLETTVCDSNDPFKNVQLTENKNYDLSFNGVGSRPSTAMIERLLSENNMNYVRLDHAKLNSDKYIYDWQEKNNNECDFYKRRLWFAIRKTSGVQFSQNVIKSATSSAINKKTTKLIYTNSFNSLNELKVAVCISGHLRTFDKVYKSFIDNIVKPSEHKISKLDTFVNTWETIGSKLSKNGSDDCVANVNTNDKIDEINKIINPTILNIDKYNDCKNLLNDLEKRVKLSNSDKAGLHNNHISTYGAMLYNMYNTKKILEEYENKNNFTYDLVIRLRTDLLFRHKINLLDFNIDSLYIPQIGKYLNNGMNDQFAIGNSRNIKIYLSIFEKFIDYINNRETTIRPESLIRHHLIKNGVNIVEFPINYSIVRPDGRVTEQTVMSQTWKKV